MIDAAVAGENNPQNIGRNVTGLMLSRNRPQFLHRALRYYSRTQSPPILVLDASTEFDEIAWRKELQPIARALELDVIHHEFDTPISSRIGDALKRVNTPFVLLMADDDFYFPGWVGKAAHELSTCSEAVAVYGQTIAFEIEGYAVYGDLKSVWIDKPNPVERWLQGASAVDRLAELGKGRWGTTGWYALHRATVLSEIVRRAKRARVDIEVFERFLTIHQPIYGKVVMMDEVYLARQINSGGRLPEHEFARKESEYARLLKSGEEALREVSALSEDEARDVIRKTFAAELESLKRNDLRRKLQIPRLKRSLPYLEKVVRAAKDLGKSVQNSDPLAPDPRFPAKPAEPDRAHVALIAEACRPPAAWVNAMALTGIPG